jgi:hypothetical protein
VSSSSQEERLRGEIASRLETLRLMTPESLVRLELTPDSFADAEPILRRYWSLFEEIRKISLATVPDSVLAGLRNQVEQAYTSLNGISTFNPASYPGNEASTRMNLVNALWGQWDGCWSTLAPVISYANRTDLDISSYEQRVQSVLTHASETSANRLTELQNVLDEAKTAMNASRAEGDSMLESMHQTIGEVGVAKQARYFQEEATHQKLMSQRWLAATVVVALVTLAFGLLSPLIYPLSQPGNAQNALQQVVAKVLAFSVLSFLVFVCGRNYRATQHNLVVNTHRQNALKTFEAFVGATTDEGTRNAVLLKVTEAIFNPEQTGYLSKEIPDNRTSQILEIIKGSGGS